MKPGWWVPVLWLAVIGCGAWFTTTRLSIHNELGDLLPQGATSTQSLLLSQVRSGLSGRLILLALEGGNPDELADMSKLLGESLRGRRRLGSVVNGTQMWSKDEQSFLFGGRYLLSPNVTADTFSESSLRRALEQRLDDVRSPLAPLIKDSIPADPTGEILGILQSWSVRDAPEKYRGVWMSADHKRALLVVETRVSGFDADVQEAVQQEIRTAFRQLAGDNLPPIRLLMSGPGVFAVDIQRMIEREVWWLSIGAATLVLLFLLLSYRSPWLVLLTLIPIMSGIIAGMIAVNIWFGFVHGITLGFGITLLGVVDDYPIHLFSHMKKGSSPQTVMRTIWPTMRLGVLTTAIGFSALLLAGYPALAQLGLLALVGLLTGAFVTRWVLPSCIHSGFAPRELQSGVFSGLDRLAKGRALVPVVLALATLALLWSDTPFWQEDLGALTPLSEDQKHLDRQLRQELGVPDVRDLVVIEGSTEQDLLEKAETVMPKLEGLRQDGTVAGYDIVSRYLPSRSLQRVRQQALPERTVLEKNLAAAQKGLPFTSGLFGPFVDAVDAARNQEPIGREAFGRTMLGLKLESLMFMTQDRWVAVAPLRGVADRRQFAAIVAGWNDAAVSYVDLKEETKQLMTVYRNRTVQLLGGGTVAIAVALVFGLRSITLAWRVITPIGCSLIVVAAILRAIGESLSLFHVATFLLVIGLGLDYALFFNRPDETEAERTRTNFGLLVCSTTTILVFGVLAFSSIPVLHAIGLTAACGSFCCLLFAGMMVRKEPHAA